MTIAGMLCWVLGSTNWNVFEDQGFASSYRVAMASGSASVVLVDDMLRIGALGVAASACGDAFRSLARRCKSQRASPEAQRRAARATARSGFGWEPAGAGASLTPGMRGIAGAFFRCAEGGSGC